MKKVDVIIPVYDGYDETYACITSILETFQSSLGRVIIIDDYSPSEDIKRYLLSLSLSEHFVLIKNSKNLGFVETVNIGMSQSVSNDVLLLNSDVIVANNWLERIQRLAYTDESIGTVTPFSNNATICSFPNFCEDNDLFLGLLPEKLDEVFNSLPAEAIDIPTGVGFCLYIKRDCLDDIGFFDVQNFGRGYGEENDFCVRAAKSGWRNVLATNIFVNHLGGVSFGSEKNTRVQNAIEKMEVLHPGYNTEVFEHVKLDPAKSYRVEAIVKSYAMSEKPCVLFISHALGGGIARHLNELSQYISKQVNVFCLRPYNEKDVILEFYDASRKLKDVILFDTELEYEKLRDTLNYIGISLVHIHHIMGFPNILLRILSDCCADYDITLHDYYFINSSATQTNINGHYTADESLVVKNLPSGISCIEWREAQNQLLLGARNIISPSAAAANIYKKYFPSIDVQVVPHPDYNNFGLYPAVRPMKGNGKNLKVFVIGAISKEKGADLLDEVAKVAKSKGLGIEFKLIGYAYRPLSIPSTGPYEEGELKTLIKEADICWFPALWPETYCYTLSVALECGIPIIAPRLGAFEERLLNRPLTIEVSGINVDLYINAFLSLKEQLLKAESTVWNEQSLPSNFYKHSYLMDINKKANLDKGDSVSILLFGLRLTLPNNVGRKEKLLILLYRVRGWPVISLLTKAIPFKFQRIFKRFLSKKSLHELR